LFEIIVMSFWKRNRRWRSVSVVFFIGVLVVLELIGATSSRLFDQGPDASVNQTPFHQKETVSQDKVAPFPSMLTYPLDGFVDISSARESYQKGFWQRMEPVPFDRWKMVSNTTCYYDESSVEEWHHRVPRVVLIGTQKGGSTALAHYLYNHPNILKLPKKELHFFDETMDQSASIIANEQGIPAQTALRNYQESVIGSLVPLQVLQMDASRGVLDATPNYLFPSDRVPQRICCITPWVKLLCLLRNPVDRAFSQYNMQFNRDLANPKTRRGFASFEEYIELDLNVLRETGVVQDWSVVDFETFSGSAQELQAWQTYTKLGLNAPVGRGLYAIQLRHWLRAMDECGKPRSDLLVLKSEEMKVATDEVYAKVLEFLDLKPHHMESYGKVHTTAYRASGMDPATRETLDDFYRPYNMQLEKVLGQGWAGAWN
jgi:hypothetical protein